MRGEDAKNEEGSKEWKKGREEREMLIVENHEKIRE